MTDDNKKIAFDPWTATKESLYDDIQSFWVSEAARYRVLQWEYAQQVQELKDEVHKGDPYCLIECIAIIFKARLTPPEWLASYFNKRHQSICSGEYLSWDDIFGKPTPYMTDRKRADAEIHNLVIGDAIGYHIYRDILITPNKTMQRRYEDAADIYNSTPEKAAKFYRSYIKNKEEISKLTDERLKRLGVPKPPTL